MAGAGRNRKTVLNCMLVSFTGAELRRDERGGGSRHDAQPTATRRWQTPCARRRYSAVA
jgi:hypothetical protein